MIVLIEACKQLIRQIEDELSVLNKDSNNLDVAQTQVSQNDKLAEASDTMMRSVEKAYSASTGLRIMDQYRADMKEAISGSRYKDASSGLSELVRDISEVRAEISNRIARLKEKLKSLANDLSALLTGGGS